jgi:hypothetical protein
MTHTRERWKVCEDGEGFVVGYPILVKTLMDDDV